VPATVTDNVSNLVRAINPQEATETIQVITNQKILHMRCDRHSAVLALGDIVKHCPSSGASKKDMEKLLQILRRKEAKTQFRACGITQKNPLIQYVKLTTYTDTLLFIWECHGTTNALMVGQRVSKPPFWPWSEDDDTMRAILDGLRRFTLLVDGGLVPLARFYGLFLGMRQDLLNMEDNLFAMELHDNLADRF
jgi:hypothetical protein